MQALIDRPMLIQNQAMIDPTKNKREDANAILAKKIARAIEDSGKAAKEIAAACGVRAQAVTTWKKYGRISKDTLKTFADFVGLPLAHFYPSGEPSSQAGPLLSLVDVPRNRDSVSGSEMLRLQYLYLQSDDDGRRSIMDAAGLAASSAGAVIDDGSAADEKS
jgi:hypothetical protein